jgi:hypothetical protein
MTTAREVKVVQELSGRPPHVWRKSFRRPAQEAARLLRQKPMIAEEIEQGDNCHLSADKYKVLDATQGWLNHHGIPDCF